MNILVTINAHYIKQLNILLNSIQKSNKDEEFDVYIINRDLNKEQIEQVKNKLDLEKFHIHDIKIDEAEIKDLPVYEQRYPLEIYFRIFAAKYLPTNIDRVLYLDADTLVINKLNELYSMDFEGNYLIATTHISKMLHKFKEIRLDVNNIISKEELIEKINKLDIKNNQYIKIILIGNRNFEIDKYELLKYVTNERIIKIKDNTKIAYDLEKISNENTLKGLYAKEMLDILNSENMMRRRKRDSK